MFVVHETLPKNEKWKNNVMSNYKISYFSYGNGFFFLKKYIIIHLLLKKLQ
jgi:hypothetical protein